MKQQVLDFSKPRTEQQLLVRFPGDGHEYTIPYVGGMTLDETKEIMAVYAEYEDADSMAAQMGALEQIQKIFCKWIPEELFRTLTNDEFQALVNAWSAGNKASGGVGTGE